MIREINIWEYIDSPSCNDILVDLRESSLYEFGTLPKAINIPIDKIEELYRLPHGRRICLFCQTGELSGEIAELLSDNGYDTVNLKGGYREYLRRSLANNEKPD